MLDEFRAVRADLHRFEYHLVRYYPDLIHGEFVAIGVIVWEEGKKDVAAVKLTRDWSRVQSLDPECDTEYLEAMEAQWSREIAELGGRRLIEQLSNSLSLNVRLTETYPTMAPDLNSALSRLMDRHVEWKTSPPEGDETGPEDSGGGRPKFVRRNP